MNDFRFALRQLSRRPGYAFTTVLTTVHSGLAA